MPHESAKPRYHFRFHRGSREESEKTSKDFVTIRGMLDFVSSSGVESLCIEYYCIDLKVRKPCYLVSGVTFEDGLLHPVGFFYEI